MELSKEARQARNKYARKWREKNKEKVKASQERYWERQAAKIENTDVTDNKSLSVTGVTDNLSVTNCLNCGEVFTPKRSDAKFCTPKCRVSFNRKH